tara:strand:+ start:2354 stop:2656 length:303 start_codon:yes stop_codon:yes gene_type:complete
MINKDSKNTKLQLLIDKIKNVDSKYGHELCDILLSRIEIKTDQFFQDFQFRSKRSFDLYWNKITNLKNRFDDLEISKTNINEGENIIPKFIEEFEQKIKK